jgi:hypothetical protein
MNEQRLPLLPAGEVDVWFHGHRVDRAFTADQMQAYARAALAAQGVPADPCLVLWQAMNEAEKVGNRTDDKLIVEFLRRAGYCIAATPAPPQAQQAGPLFVQPVSGDKLWLWQDGHKLLAYRHEYPCYSPGGDPCTLGEPVAVAEYRESYDR